MTKNLETADTIIKLILAITVVVFYSTHLITGPFATVLMILSVVVIIVFATRAIFALIFRTRRDKDHRKPVD
jgi:hypothetical protein